MKCQYCSTNNPDNEVSCVKCGAPLEASVKSEAISLREEESRSFSFPVKGTVISSPEMRFFKEGSCVDVSATYFRGSMSVSGNNITTKETCNLKAGRWVMSIYANVDGEFCEIKTVPVIVNRRNWVAT